MYGVSITVLLAHYELDGTIIILMLKWIHVTSLTLFILGAIIVSVLIIILRYRASQTARFTGGHDFNLKWKNKLLYLIVFL